MFSDSPNCFATYFGESCHTKLLYLVDGKDGVETANLLNHSILFKELKNYPIKNTPFVETLLNMYKKEVATLTSENVRLKNTLKKTIDEHTEKNESLQQENNELKVQTEYLQDELKQVKTEYMKLIELQKSFTENDIKDRKQLAEIENQAVSSKLHSNELKIEMEDHQHKSKEKIAALEEKLLKLQRLLLYERKLNEDMKEKYEVLKTDSNDLNEEYSTLKLNYNILRDEYKTQRNSSENANQVFKTNLTEKDEQLDNKNAELNFQCKIFIDEIKKILKKTNDESVKLEDVNIEDDLSSLKRSLHLHICKLDSTVESLLGSIKDCKFAMKSIEEKLAGSSTENCMLKIENEEKQQKIVDLEKLFQRLSNEYKLRLDQYINDMKKYFNNDSLINDKHQIGLFIDSFKENYVKESQYKDDLLSRLEEKIKKLQCYQRQYIISYKLHMNDCTKKSSYLDEHVLHLSLPGEAQQEDFFMKENFDLQKRTREMQETIKVLESELENYKTMKFASSRYNVNNHSFEVNNSNQFNRQSYLEKERAGLLTRCLLAEERMKAQERRLEEVKMKWSMEVEQLYDQLNQYEVSAPRRYLPINENDNIQYEHFLPPIEPSPGTMPYK